MLCVATVHEKAVQPVSKDKQLAGQTHLARGILTVV